MPGLPDDMRARILTMLIEALRPQLGEYGVFVSNLALQQHLHSNRMRKSVFDIDELYCDILLSEYIADCIRLFRYRISTTNSKERSDIQDHFVVKKWASFVKILVAHLGYAEATESDARDYLEDFELMLLDPEWFHKVVDDYDPAKGKTFSAFLRTEVIWRAQELARAHRLREAPIETVPLRPDAFLDANEDEDPPDIGDTFVAGDRNMAVAPLDLDATCLEKQATLNRIRQKQIDAIQNDPSLSGLETILWDIFVLRMKAYVSPEHLSEAFRVAISAKPWTLVRGLFTEFETLNGELHALDQAFSDARFTFAKADIARERLAEIIDPTLTEDLERITNDSSITLEKIKELRKQLNRLQSRPNRGTQEWLDAHPTAVKFMDECVRCRNAKGNACNTPPVNPQEIETSITLTGIEQLMKQPKQGAGQWQGLRIYLEALKFMEARVQCTRSGSTIDATLTADLTAITTTLSITLPDIEKLKEELWQGRLRIHLGALDFMDACVRWRNADSKYQRVRNDWDRARHAKGRWVRGWKEVAKLLDEACISVSDPWNPKPDSSWSGKLVERLFWAAF